jgi:hypothetical protein
MITKVAASLYMSMLAVACIPPAIAQQTREQLIADMGNVEANEVDPPSTKAAPFAAVAQGADAAAGKPHTFAQKLVDEELAKHPDIVILVFHVVNKDESDYPIIASNIGRYGKKADEDDLRVIRTGKPNLEVNAAGNHFEVEMALHDTSQKTLGAIAVVYNYKTGDSKEALQKKAESVRAEVEKQIPTLDKLLESAQ